MGIDHKSIHDCVAHGWLVRVIRGVYRRPLPESTQGVSGDTWAIPLLSLQWIMKREIYLAGYSHYVGLGHSPRVHFYELAPRGSSGCHAYEDRLAPAYTLQ